MECFGLKCIFSSTGTGMVNLIHRNAGDPSSNLGGPTTLSSKSTLINIKILMGERYYGG
jgi:hypothetical protein